MATKFIEIWITKYYIEKCFWKYHLQYDRGRHCASAFMLYVDICVSTFLKIHSSLPGQSEPYGIDQMYWRTQDTSLIARFIGPTGGPSKADRSQVGAMVTPWTLLSGTLSVAAIRHTHGRHGVSRSLFNDPKGKGAYRKHNLSAPTLLSGNSHSKFMCHKKRMYTVLWRQFFYNCISRVKSSQHS